MYVKDTFKDSKFLPHWEHIQGALLSPGCGGVLEEPPAATFQGVHIRKLKTLAVDTRCARFILFTAVIGSPFGNGLCRSPNERIHNVFLQYSIDGGKSSYSVKPSNNKNLTSVAVSSHHHSQKSYFLVV